MFDQPALTKVWFDAFEQTHGIKPIWGGKQGKLLKTLIEYCVSNKIANLDEVMKWYLKTDGEFANETGHDFAVFCAQFAKNYIQFKAEIRKKEKLLAINKKYNQSAEDTKQMLDETYERVEKTPEESIQIIRKALEKRYGGNYTQDNLRHAVHLNRLFGDNLTKLREHTAKAIVQLWGRDAYLHVFNEKKELQQESIEEKRNNMLTWAKNNG